MSNRQFDRIASITIGKAGSANAVVVTENKISFTASKFSDKTKNRATIRIHNLSKDTRNRIDRVDDLVVIEAGYRQGSGLASLFVGNIVSVTSATIQPDVVTVIEALDGNVALRDTNLSVSFAPGTKCGDIIDKVVSALSLPYTKVKELFGTAEFTNAFSFAGPASDALTKVTGKLGLEWAIRNNELVIVKKGQTDGNVAPLLSPSSGMIGSPQRVDDIRKGSEASDKQPGWKITSLLRPEIEVSSGIIVQSKEIEKQTIFRVESVEHIGDNYGDEWTSSTVVSEIL